MENDYIVIYSYDVIDKKWKVKVVNQDNNVVDEETAIDEEKALNLAKRLAKRYRALRVSKRTI